MTLEKIQPDLDAWIDSYNYERSHQGKMENRVTVRSGRDYYALKRPGSGLPIRLVNLHNAYAVALRTAHNRAYRYASRLRGLTSALMSGGHFAIRAATRH
jgi:hypothetical protein